MKTKSLLLATALLMSTSALAQKNTFKGVVLDDLGEPVIGATVQVKGVKGAGAITDLDGKKLVIINDIIFKGKQHIKWDDVENYLKRHKENLKYSHIYNYNRSGIGFWGR